MTSRVVKLRQHARNSKQRLSDVSSGDKLRTRLSHIRASLSTANAAARTQIDAKLDDAVAKFRVRRRAELVRLEERRAKKRARMANARIVGVEKAAAAKRRQQERAAQKATAKKTTRRARRS